MRAYGKDTIRSMIKGHKRFFALMMITALGVCMLGGIKAGCDDLRYSADAFFDEQNLYDIAILSTLGLTEEDMDVVARIEGIELVEGTYTEDVYTRLSDGSKKQATMKVLSEKGINVPYLLEGEFPDKVSDILVTEKYIHESGKQVGDIIYIEEKIGVDEKSPNFLLHWFTISGVIIDVTDVNSTEGVTAFRNNATTDYTFYVKKDVVKSDIYTAMYLTLQGTDELACYSMEYEQKVDEIVTLLENEIKEDREQARYDKVTKDALEEIAKAEEEMWEAFDEAEEEIADAKQKISDGQTEIDKNEEKLTQAERDSKKGERELEKGERKLDRAEAEYADGVEQYKDAKAQLDAGKEALKEAETALDESEKQLEESEKQLDETYPQMLAYIDNQIVLKQIEIAEAEAEGASQEKIDALNTELTQLQDSKASMVEEEAKAREEIANGRKQIANGREELKKQKAELEAGQAELAGAKAELENARAQLDLGWAELETGWAELSTGEDKIYEGWDKIADAKKELEDGRQELAENITKYESEKSEALQKIADAKQEVADIKMTEWYIATRTSLGGYSTIQTDADCIEALGNAFPILFLTIAILISLTTMSRMIEEDRGLIGTYKALGLFDGEIRRKYMIYALMACMLGGILGDVLGYVVLPEILFYVFGVMYQLPKYYLGFHYLYGIGGIVLFMAGIVGAAYFSCNSVLKGMPASLMRPKAPSLGSRVLLERVTPIWSKLSFLNKVTARNLFRYKKRLFMTLFGIAGCTALLLAGFTIKDTVSGLMTLQYEETYRYDAVLVAEDNEKMLTYLEEEALVRKYINIMMTNVKIITENGKEETVQLVVVPDEEKISRFIRLYDEEGERVTLTDEDVFVTKNISMVAGFREEDFVVLQTMNLEQSDMEVTKIVMNYIGNSIYMTESMYEESFDAPFEPNSAYVILKGEREEQDIFLDKMKESEGILSAMGRKNMQEGFDGAFRIINLVVYIIIVLAASLAFVVLFTLATTNISERERELATIKVLGFFDKEVHAYVNKETLILTGLGILLGIPLGKILGIWLMSVLEMPSIYFYPNLYPKSYVYATVLSIGFALLVNLMTNKTLNKIDPVEALKSVE